MSPALLQSLCLQARAGGERFQREPGGLPRSLKKQYQSANVPEHERAGPLLWAAGRLLFAPGLGIDARSRAAVGEPQLALRWCPERMSSASTQIVFELDS
jgi:tRNA(Ile)-lysidine synthase